ncbi:hypothetical protein HHX47_DHR3000003 [Lentinula edodes]|nr:hypothetical protein HHX47_DHR3000003 [Lentinula edodes]
MPIRTRHATLCLRYLKYLMDLLNTHYASLALEENIKLRNSGSACWLSDLDFAIAHLPGNHRLPPLYTLDGDQIDKLIKAVNFSTKSELQTHIDSWSKLSLLCHHLELKEEGPAKAQIIGLRHYLTQVSIHSHCRTITKLLCGDLTPPSISRLSLTALHPNDYRTTDLAVPHMQPSTGNPPAHLFPMPFTAEHHLSTFNLHHLHETIPTSPRELCFLRHVRFTLPQSIHL